MSLKEQDLMYKAFLTDFLFNHRKIIFLFIFLFCVENTYAQKWYEKRTPFVNIWGYPRSKSINLLDREYSKNIHFGFGLGFNTFDFLKIVHSGNTVNIQNQGNTILNADLVHLKPGFNVNAIMDYRLTKNINIRLLPGIFFGKRELDFYRDENRAQIGTVSIISNYFEIPLIFKFSANRYSNFRPFVITGINNRINFSNKISLDSERYIGMKKIEPFIEGGFGFDFYLSYVRMSTEIKWSAGLVNALTDEVAPGYEYYRNSLKSIQSNMLVFTLSFEL